MTEHLRMMAETTPEDEFSEFVADHPELEAPSETEQPAPERRLPFGLSLVVNIETANMGGATATRTNTSGPKGISTDSCRDD